MRDKTRKADHSSLFERPGDGSVLPDSIDPDLRAIRRIIDFDTTPPDTTRAGSAKPGKTDAGSRQPSMQRQTSARRLKARAVAFLRRPDAPRLLAVALLVIFVLVDPGFVLFLSVIALLTGLIVFFSLGPDRVQAWVIRRYRRLHERDPDAAERLRQRAARISRRLSAVIERLPEKWTTGLYLPDFELSEDPPEKWKSDPFERLAQH